MNKANRIGILIVIFGFFIPSIMYPFTSLSPEGVLIKFAYANRGILYKANLDDLEIVLVKGEWKQTEKHYEGRLAIPYKYFIAVGILVVFIGISIIVLTKNKKQEMNE